MIFRFIFVIIVLIIILGVLAFVGDILKSNDLIHIAKGIFMVLIAIYVGNVRSND